MTDTKHVKFATQASIRRNHNSWNLDLPTTADSGILLRQIIDNFGQVINPDTTESVTGIAALIKAKYPDAEAQHFAEQLSKVTSVTFAVFDDKECSGKPAFNYSIIGKDFEDAEALIDLIALNEIDKPKYKDGKERYAVVFSSEGIVLKSTPFSAENPNIKKANKNKP